MLEALTGPGVFRGLRCNASRLRYAELDECEVLDDGEPEELAIPYRDIPDAMPRLNIFRRYCGSDLRHMSQIARAAKPECNL